MSVDNDLRRLPLVFVDSLAAPTLTDGDLHHLQKSLRLRLGDPIAVGDGNGSWAPARLGVVAELTAPVITVAAPAETVGVAFAPVKAERPDFVVQKLVELGIDRIVVIETRRSVVRWDAARGAKQHDRWLKIATEACLQSKRLHRPTIVGPVALDQLGRGDCQLIFAEPGAPMLGRGMFSSSGDSACRIVCIGPEGGWAPEEIEAQELVGLPGSILRAETAAIAAGVLLAANRVI